jgi:hypothetical protein
MLETGHGFAWEFYPANPALNFRATDLNWENFSGGPDI